MSKDISYIADHYGFDSQSRQLIEEMGELTSAINHFWRKCLKHGSVSFSSGAAAGAEYEHMLEELGDVYLCLQQLIYLTGAGDAVNDYIKSKIRRQLERINKA